MVKYPVKVNAVLNVSDEDLIDILTTALEGGIDYWCRSITVMADTFSGDSLSDYVVAGGTLVLTDEDENEYKLTKDGVIRGLEAFISADSNPLRVIECGELDTGAIDSEIADTIIQYALFNEIIYG